MNSNASFTWPLYPLVGPPIGLIVAMLSSGRFYINFEIIMLSYMTGGLQALFVGLWVAYYEKFHGRVPIWVPLIPAMIAFSLLAAWSFLMGGVHGATAGGSVLMLLIHIVPAFSVWSLIRVVGG